MQTAAVTRTDPVATATRTSPVVNATISSASDCWGGSRIEKRPTLVFRQSTPDAVRLAYVEGVCQAHLPNRAGSADGLRGIFSRCTPWTALGFGVEEHIRVGASAECGELPVPRICVRTRKAAEVGHGGLLR